MYGIFFTQLYERLLHTRTLKKASLILTQKSSVYHHLERTKNILQEDGIFQSGQATKQKFAVLPVQLKQYTVYSLKKEALRAGFLRIF